MSPAGDFHPCCRGAVTSGIHTCGRGSMDPLYRPYQSMTPIPETAPRLTPRQVQYKRLLNALAFPLLGSFGLAFLLSTVRFFVCMFAGTVGGLFGWLILSIVLGGITVGLGFGYASLLHEIDPR